jgi:hypothetical protein
MNCIQHQSQIAWMSATLSGLLRGSAIGSTPAFGAGYLGSSPSPGATSSRGCGNTQSQQLVKMSQVLGALGYAAGVRRTGSAFFTKRGFCILRYSEVSRSRLSNCCSEPALTRVEILDFGATISPLSCEENRPLSRQPSPRLKECQGISTTYSQPRLGALPDFLLECLRNLRTNRSLTAT